MIFKFEPHYFERAWGGQSLRHVLSRKIPSGKKIGESWELVDREDYQSSLTNHEYKTYSIRELLQLKSEFIMGPGWDKNRRFPILVKWLDCTERLSLQVHPPARWADALGGQPKTENWYIMHADDNAALFLGLKKGKTKKDFLEALAEENLESVCQQIKSKPGNSVLVESGRMHAIDGGNLILEIQQNSDTTYRVYDWGRRDKNGNSRKLHVEESLKCIDFNDTNVEIIEANHEPVQTLADCEHFRIRKFKLHPNRQIRLKDLNEQCVLLNPIGTSLQIGQMHLDSGHTGLSPYGASCTISSDNEGDLIVTDNFTDN